MMRLALRPQRKERNAMIRSSKRLPRSRCLTHSAALGWPSMRLADLGFMQRAAGHFALVDANREMNQPRRGRDMPGFEVNSPRLLDDLEHLIQQQGARQHRKSGEMTCKRRVVGGDVE